MPSKQNQTTTLPAWTSYPAMLRRSRSELTKSSLGFFYVANPKVLESPAWGEVES